MDTTLQTTTIILIILITLDITTTAIGLQNPNIEEKNTLSKKILQKFGLNGLITATAILIITLTIGTTGITLLNTPIITATYTLVILMGIIIRIPIITNNITLLMGG